VVNVFWRKTDYLGWDEYASFVSELDDLLWRQAVRERSLANL